MIKLEFNGSKIEIKSTKIVAAARNYKAHAEEMKVSIPDEPEIFLKPPSALITNNDVVILPKVSKRIDHEVELAVIIKNRCHNISIKEVVENILGYTVLVDVTARDIQEEARKSGMPWSISKGFDTFAPIGPKIIAAGKIDVNNLDIWLKVNGEYKQQSNTRYMIFSTEKLISFTSKIMTLEPMDIIASGTPEGVGPMNDGDFIEAGIEGIGVLKFSAKKE
ncbi:fumarylacetoacetate hydrolase family protein, partial [candidate division WOR-3 bacterium]|nr:fumarylacetoacetate hydrolase family protein [candidate division WOR-3 bacterium]